MELTNIEQLFDFISKAKAQTTASLVLFDNLIAGMENNPTLFSEDAMEFLASIMKDLKRIRLANHAANSWLNVTLEKINDLRIDAITSMDIDRIKYENGIEDEEE